MPHIPPLFSVFGTNSLTNKHSRNRDRGPARNMSIKFEDVGKVYPNGYEGLKLTVDGVDVMSLSGKALRRFRRKIGMIFQSFNLITRTTVIRNVLTAFVPDMPWYRSAFGIYTKEEKMKALECLDKVGIVDKAFVRADQLSGGQQQRVALARTLAQNPQIILADEPVAALDPVTAKTVMDDFTRINKDMNITILINIHHVDLALQYCQRVIGIRAGEIVYDGPAADVNDAVLKQIYEGGEKEE